VKAKTTIILDFIAALKRTRQTLQSRLRVNTVTYVINRNGEAGQSLVLVALGLTVLLGILGFAVDMGYYRYVRRELQNAADAAAIAGAMDVSYGTWKTAGESAASENGFPKGGNTTVKIDNPPSAGPYAGSTYPTYVQATITQKNVPVFFSKIFGAQSPTLSATSVAAGGTNCIYGLDQNSGGAISITFSLINSNCGVVDNSNLSGALAALCAPSLQLKGSDTIFIGFTCGSGFTAAKPVKITTPAPDPFANLPKPFVNPMPASCVGNAGSNTIAANGATVSPTPVFCGGTIITGKTGITVSPGTYFGSPAFRITNSTVTFQSGTYFIVSRTAGTPGIQLNATVSHNNTVSFGSGTYTVYGGISDSAAFGTAVNWNNAAGSSAMFIMDGGGLKLIGNQGNSGAVGLASGGVTFYNTGTAGAGTVTSYGPIINYFDFAASCGAACQLSAPTSGTYAGILFFQDPNNTATTSCGFGSSTANACFAANSSNGGSIAQAGAYYFPNSKVSFNFDFGVGAPYSFLVANDISWFANFTFNRNYTNLPNGSPLKQGSAVLVQ
jgi:Putative Flp pilus-assembly TadE/G-like